jgi:high-affinity nickel-transport protein
MEMPNALQLALWSCALLGLRHGFDYDHLAAISDITSVQRGWREGMRLGLLYALGHALTVAALGSAVIFLHLSLPAGLDAVGERLVGLTLIALSVYVLVAFARRREAGHGHVSRSRMALMISGARYAGWRVRRVWDREAVRPEAFAFRYDRGSVLVVGMIHGLGAETPSQLLLFLLAANLGGTSRGFLGLVSFLAGLLVMNTVMTASASGIVAGSRQRPWMQGAVASLTAVYSLVIGVVFLLGTSEKLPALVR